MALDQTSPVLTDFLALTKAALIPAPSRAFVSAGSVAWDECCDGQTWVRVTSLVPDPPTDQRCSVDWWDAGIEVGVLRCASVVDDRGNAPSASRLTAEAQSTARDMWNLAEAIRCYFADVPTVVHVDLGTWTPLGAEGGCVGGTWTATVRLAACACPDETHIGPLGSRS